MTQHFFPPTALSAATAATHGNSRGRVSIAHKQQQRTRGENIRKNLKYQDDWYCITLNGNTMNL